jgi:DNA-binding CsgD family transcriptional regulator
MELQVAVNLITGKTEAQTARLLKLKTARVKKMMNRLHTKMNVTDLAGLVSALYKSNYLNTDETTMYDHKKDHFQSNFNGMVHFSAEG